MADWAAGLGVGEGAAPGRVAACVPMKGVLVRLSKGSRDKAISVGVEEGISVLVGVAVGGLSEHSPGPI